MMVVTFKDIPELPAPGAAEPRAKAAISKSHDADGRNWFTLGADRVQGTASAGCSDCGSVRFGATVTDFEI